MKKAEVTPAVHRRHCLDSAVPPVLDPGTDVFGRREVKITSSRRLCIFVLCFAGKCGERSAPTAILHNGERARECGVGVGADSSAPHSKAALKGFGENLGGVCQHAQHSRRQWTFTVFREHEGT